MQGKTKKKKKIRKSSLWSAKMRTKKVRFKPYSSPWSMSSFFHISKRDLTFTWSTTTMGSFFLSRFMTRWSLKNLFKPSQLSRVSKKITRSKPKSKFPMGSLLLSQAWEMASILLSKCKRLSRKTYLVQAQDQVQGQASPKSRWYKSNLAPLRAQNIWFRSNKLWML